MPMASALRLRLRLRFIEVLEVGAVGRNHQKVARRAHCVSIRLHASIETVELRVLRVRLRVDLARRRIALSASLARLAGGVGEDLGLLRSEEHTSELQSHVNLVCRLLLEK